MLGNYFMTIIVFLFSLSILGMIHKNQIDNYEGSPADLA